MTSDEGSGLTMDLQFLAGVSITKISGPDLADWQAPLAENKKRVVHVHWQTRDLLRRQIEIEYNFAQPLTAGEWKLQSPKLVDGEAEPPLYVVVAEQGLELTAATQTAAPRQLPKWLFDRVVGTNYLVFIGDVPLNAKWLPLVETAQV